MQFLITHSLPSFKETIATIPWLWPDRKDGFFLIFRAFLYLSRSLCLELLHEMMEKYVTVKIYRKVQVADKIADYKFFERVSSLSFISTKNLDVTVPIDASYVIVTKFLFPLSSDFIQDSLAHVATFSRT